MATTPPRCPQVKTNYYAKNLKRGGKSGSMNPGKTVGNAGVVSLSIMSAYTQAATNALDT